MSSPSPEPLLTVRAAVVVLLALVIGLIAGGLGFLAYRDAATAALVGGAAAGFGLQLFHGLLTG